jgi:FkbM family methyltransferase
MFKKILKQLIPHMLQVKLRETWGIFFDGFSMKSYSQEGEDLILNRIFENKRNGFYVDVGAHHPMRFSNTYIFYKRGWTGINIDAMPGSMSLFNKIRPADKNLEFPISDKPEVLLTYYAFNEPALNGFSRELSMARDGKVYKIIFRKDMQTKTLAQVFEEYLPRGQVIDFLTIDVEGLDYEVLKSNNWEKYSPKIVLVEVLGEKLEDIIRSELGVYMSNKGYFVFAKTHNTVFFKLDNDPIKFPN